ncbi:sporulation membrane protein YtrI [Alkalibacillus salilacus]|uniref:Gas vesicle protein n=1 Tax=Alkalibacillus salilacus TaxID=284582 RepID=A0ABT9VGT7_9BACI|nr:sporulation membrane protein YtrI [Alkalibacillus salilacus]MDQ0160183.1 gas vesicle protein [Alkalibacillus salilacus]
MHIPPYYKKASWQTFLIGVLTGVVIGYIFFLFVYGQHTERWIEENLSIRNELHELEQENELLKSDQSDLNEEAEQRVTVQKIEISWTNAEKLDLDRFTTHELKEILLDELESVVGQNIISLSEQRTLLLRTIENKTFNIRDVDYQLAVRHMTIGPTLILSIEVKIASS